jgi:hypothetical protein
MRLRRRFYSITDYSGSIGTLLREENEVKFAWGKPKEGKLNL